MQSLDFYVLYYLWSQLSHIQFSHSHFYTHSQFIFWIFGKRCKLNVILFTHWFLYKYTTYLNYSNWLYRIQIVAFQKNVVVCKIKDSKICKLNILSLLAFPEEFFAIMRNKLRNCLHFCGPVLSYSFYFPFCRIFWAKSY